MILFHLYFKIVLANITRLVIFQILDCPANATIDLHKINK